MFVMDAISPIANRVKRQLEESGQIGKHEVTEKVLLDLPLNAVDGGSTEFIEKMIGLEEGKNYTVTTDSGTYQAVCRVTIDDILMLGNGVIMDEQDTGEPFSVFENKAGPMSMVVDFNAGTHMKVSEVTETITPISDKYLPAGFGGGGLTVVEFGAIDFDAFPITITDEKVVAALESTAKNGTPCIIKIDFGGMIMATVFGFVSESDTVFGFSGVMQGATFQIMCDSGQWSVSIVGA